MAPGPTEQLSFVQVTGQNPDADALIAAHHALMRSQSPEESCHALDADGLRANGASLFLLRDANGKAVAIGAFQFLAAQAVELKSMHIVHAKRGRGWGQVLLTRLLEAARADGATSAWLETGSAKSFDPARALYERAEFRYCDPFGDYQPDPLSVFMTRTL